jgi:hypothetical protein
MIDDVTSKEILISDGNDFLKKIIIITKNLLLGKISKNQPRNPFFVTSHKTKVVLIIILNTVE